MTTMRTSILLLISITALAEEPSPAPQAAASSTEADRIRLLEERIAKLEAMNQAAEGRIQQTPLISFGPTGMVLRTPDGKTTIQTPGLVQADGRAFLGQADKLTDTFLLRRLRTSIDAT